MRVQAASSDRRDAPISPSSPRPGDALCGGVVAPPAWLATVAHLARAAVAGALVAGAIDAAGAARKAEAVTIGVRLAPAAGVRDGEFHAAHAPLQPPVTGAKRVGHAGAIAVRAARVRAGGAVGSRALTDAADADLPRGAARPVALALALLPGAMSGVGGCGAEQGQRPAYESDGGATVASRRERADEHIEPACVHGYSLDRRAASTRVENPT